MKFIGPDASKTWKRLTMKNPTVDSDQPTNGCNAANKDRSLSDNFQVQHPNHDMTADQQKIGFDTATEDQSLSDNIQIMI